ncbi:hypothetical protein RI367_003337 [Sorochytrium milnesiophthora]
MASPQPPWQPPMLLLDKRGSLAETFKAEGGSKERAKWIGWACVSEVEYKRPKHLPDKIAYAFEVAIDWCDKFSDDTMDDAYARFQHQLEEERRLEKEANTVIILDDDDDDDETPSGKGGSDDEDSVAQFRPLQKTVLGKSERFRAIPKNLFFDRNPNYDIHPAICQCVPIPQDTDKQGEEEQAVTGDELVGCGENCLNRNQRFQRQEWAPALEVFKTANRGNGLFTFAPIRRGELVVEYLGDIISRDTCLERMETPRYAASKNFYFLHYHGTEVIDGTQRGCLARFANHSCEPNCHIEKWYFDGEYHVGIFASRNIEPEEEITYDYNFSNFSKGDSALQRCLCGSKRCRKTLGEAKEKVDVEESALPAPVARTRAAPSTAAPAKKRNSLHARVSARSACTTPPKRRQPSKRHKSDHPSLPSPVGSTDTASSGDSAPADILLESDTANTTEKQNPF